MRFNRGNMKQIWEIGVERYEGIIEDWIRGKDGIEELEEFEKFGQKFRQKINEENENEGLGKNINDAAGKVHQRYFEEVIEWIGDKERTDEDRITVLEVVEKLKKENEKIWGIIEMAKRWDEAVD